MHTPAHRTTHTTVRACSAILLAMSLTACESGGRGSTGWRFGPAQPAPRNTQPSQRAIPQPEYAAEPRSDERASNQTPADGVETARSRVEERRGETSAQGRTASVAPAELRERALAMLLEIAQSGEPEERGNALEALSMTPARVAGVIEPALTSQSAGLRAVAAMVSGKAKIGGTTATLRSMLNDESVLVRSSAMYALKRLDSPVNLTPLAEMLSDPDPRIRAQAAFVLGEIGEKSALGLLREAARANLSSAGSPEVRLMDLQIAEARVKLGEGAGLSDIRSALYPARLEDLEAAALACQIVGEVRDMASVSQLINLTRPAADGGGPMPAEIRLAAAGALAKLNRQPKNAAGVAREYINSPTESIRAQAAHVLGASSEMRMLGTLEDMLTDTSARVRVAVASAIVRMTSR